MIQLALYQPDIPQNAGTILRLCACLEARAHIIHPAGFALSDKTLKRSGMDYLDHVSLTIHEDWQAFGAWCSAENMRLLGLTTAASETLYQHEFSKRDILLLGRESSGLPQEIHDRCEIRLRIPISPQTRSLNVAVAAAIALGEASRQIGRFSEASRQIGHFSD